ncbi:MAG: diaminopimelate decarboxylase [Kiloniellaceae bacterium]
MSAFAYRRGTLHAEGVALDALAEAVGTPFYCYASGALEAAYKSLAEALSGLPATICYALKANANLAVVRTLADLGAGADVVSEGELRRALAAGVPPDRIVFAGVGKTPAEMAAALRAGILQFNVESLPELETLSRVARDMGVRAPVALRVNPDVDARTHEKIATGLAENKFGIDLGHAREACARAADLPGISLEGLAVHIGSQLTDLAPFRAAFTRLAALYRELRDAGLALRRLDLGGGLGIVYRDETPADLAGYAALVREASAGLPAELIVEPGRLLVGNAGVLVTRVLYVKQGIARRFVIVDAAMNDLIRPSLYDAWHEIVPVQAPPPGAGRAPVDIVGPVCETADTFARQRPMPPVAAGALLAIRSTGAYGAVMASTYNCRLPAPEVMVRGRDYAVVRPRPDHEGPIAQERLPDWLEARPARAARGVA